MVQQEITNEHLAQRQELIESLNILLSCAVASDNFYIIPSDKRAQIIEDYAAIVESLRVS